MAEGLPKIDPEAVAFSRRNIEPAFVGASNQLPINVDLEQAAQAANRPLGELSIALSGGGYRAALFHLGALRRLREFGAVPRIKTYSCVSGGSILAAHLARVHSVKSGLPTSPEDWMRFVEDPFIAFVRTDIRTKPALVTWAWLLCLIGAFAFFQTMLVLLTLVYFSEYWVIPAVVAGLLALILLAVARIAWTKRGLGTETLARSYQVLNRGFLSAINQNVSAENAVHFIFCATDLVFGVAWKMTAEKIGSYKAGWGPTPQDFKVATAVAASSCFPPVFYPAPPHVPTHNLKGGDYEPEAERKKWLSQISLTDGGVYDNLGIEPLWHARSRKPNMLVSDGGGPLPVTSEKFTIQLIQRYAGIMQNQAISLRKRMLIDKFNDNKIKGTYWGLTSVVESYRESAAWSQLVDPPSELPGYSADFVAKWISVIRTDLAFFSPEEVGILMNHGYSVANAAILVHRPDLNSTKAKFNWPFPGLVQEGENLYRFLKSSNELFDPARRAQAKGCAPCYFARLDSYRQEANRDQSLEGKPS